MPHSGKSEYQPIDIKVVEEKYNASFVGDFCIKDRHVWTIRPIAVFYQPTPDVIKGHSYYFGVYQSVLSKSILITNAESAFFEPIVGIEADDGEIIFSRQRHDYRTSQDGSVSIDGGREYLKFSGLPTRLRKLVICKDELVVDEN
jgi:hypothetical protein